MTEDEAKTKWCPAFRGNDLGVNRPRDIETDAPMGHCIASACMAWKATGRHTFNPEREELHEFLPDGGGYCGLAYR